MINKHPFHIVQQRPWPFLTSLNIINTLSSLILAIKFSFESQWITIATTIRLFILSTSLWWKDICREGCFLGDHTCKVYSGLKYGILIFIIREIIFFFRFFWAYFNFNLSPDLEVGYSWPTTGCNIIHPFHLPLLNTLILVSSGATITWAHYLILKKNIISAKINLLITILLGLLFSCLQLYEYSLAPFRLNDCVFGSAFFITTGFHGAHVIAGTIFLRVNLIRIYLRQINQNHHFRFEAASWYWHFVDVVWIYLYIFIYWWYF